MSAIEQLIEQCELADLDEELDYRITAYPDAAKEIATLRARVAELENALDPFAQAGLRVKDMSIGERKHFHADDHISTSALIEAAAALGDPKKE